MNYRNLLFSLTGLFLIGTAIFYGYLTKETPIYTPRSIDTHLTSYGFNDAAEWYFNLKKNQVTGIIDHRDVLEARKKATEVSKAKGSSSLSNFSWSEVGPDNMAGRTRAIIIDKDNHNLLFAAGVAGGIFKSATQGTSWVRINDFAENLAVTCMAQCPITGHIYAGTGEGLASPRANPNGGTAFIGKGVYKSTDKNTFSLLSSTVPTTLNTTLAEWATVNEIAVDENGWVYAATNRGLRLSKDGGDTWTNPIIFPNAPYSGDATDVNIVKVGNNKTVVVSVNNRCFVSNTGDSDYINRSTGTLESTTELPVSGLTRIEFAIAPSNPNYIYACAANIQGNLHNVYRSTNKGETWEIIGLGGTSIFEPLRAQGWYNNTLAVFPNNPNKIILGGIDIWSWEQGSNWTQRTLWYLPETNPYYVHADIHRFVFHPTDPNTFYIGSDGGVSRSTDGGITYQTINKNLNTIQFYSIATSATGEVLGGTQDNGTILISKKGNTAMSGRQVRGGDGGYASFSIINPDAIYATSQYAALGRSFNRGDIFYPSGDGTNPFFSDKMSTIEAAFVTPFLLWETFNDTYSTDSVIFTATDTSYQAGDLVKVMSKNSYLFDYVLPQAVNQDDTIYVQDIIQSKFYLGVSGGIWMTKEALDFSVQPQWFKIANFSGTAQTMSISKCGNYLYAGTSSAVFRISNLRYANDSLSADVSSPFNVVETKLLSSGLPSGRVPTSISIDPRDPNHVVITYGNYSNDFYIYRSTNALSETPTFQSRQGNLPKMPVYASIIEMNNSSIVLVGTEYGVFATDNISSPQPVWVNINDGLANVPVYMIRQQIFDYPGVTNYGVIYAGTHGRGAFEAFTFMSTNETQNEKITLKPDLKVFPNPAIDNVNITFTSSSTQKANIQVYDIRGRMVDSFEFSANSGTNTFTFSCSNYSKGTYIVRLVSESTQLSTKFIVY